MGAPATLASLVPALVAAYLCLLAPGQAVWRGACSGAPRLLTRVALSVLWTTAVGLTLTALDSFSLPRLTILNGLAALIGYLLVGRVRREGAEAPHGAGFGLVVAATALMLYWPAYETHFGASDSSTYLAAGIHLARKHELTKTDSLAEHLPAPTRTWLFRSVTEHPTWPPFTRLPGGLVIESPLADEVRPSFFPVPMVWSALFADALGARHAGGFAPLFAALAVWSTWYFARRRLGGAGALLATALIAGNAACYWAGRFALSEPMAWFFLWAGLVLLDAYEDDGFAGDARVAGALLAAAGLVRIEYLAFVAAALLGRYLLASTAPTRRLTPGFLAAYSLVAAGALAEAWTLPGAYTSPFEIVLGGLRYHWIRLWAHPWPTLLGCAAVAIVAIAAARRYGAMRTVAGGAVASGLFVHLGLVSQLEAARSLVWLNNYFGPVALALAVVGAFLAWRDRFVTPANLFFVVLVAGIGGLLIYNPHVSPVMPWASRRFVPLVAPALIVLAVLALARLRQRSLPAAAIVALALVATVVRPAYPSWTGGFFRGGYENLARLDQQLPAEGTLLIDARLVRWLLGPPLWLIHDRNSLQVDVSSVRARQVTTTIVGLLAKLGPVYLLKPTAAPEEALGPFIATRRVFDSSLELPFPEQSDVWPPRYVDHHYELVSLFELRALPVPSTPNLNRAR